MKILVLILLAGTVQAAPSAEWMGHLATLESAKLACRNIDSQRCLPYLAQAVAVADVITKEAWFDTKDKTIKAPGFQGQSRKCSDGLMRLNGEDLLHATMAFDFTDYGITYWSDALYTAAMVSNCQH